MIGNVRLAAAFACALTCSACEHGRESLLPQGAAAYDALARTADSGPDEEVIHLNDRLAVRVLGEPELTSENYRVDANGLIQMPLAGEISAAGRTPSQVRDEIVQRLGARYIRDPQVAVIVIERAKTSFAVEGAVREPGIFESAPDTTLLSAIAEAKSPTNVAQLDEVMVFRVIDGQRMGARFNLKEIRNGRADDPRILAGDTIVVGHSALKGAWREFLQAAPAFNIFYLIGSNN